MKIIVALAVLFFSGLCLSTETVTLYSTGNNLEDAKQIAFKTAIETNCGVEVLSKREQLNDKVTYDNVATHSSCRVVDYKILETLENPYRIKIEIKLQNTKKDSRFFSESNDYRFTVNLQESLNEFNREKESAHDLIKLIFKDYPYHAYNINKFEDPYITSDNNKGIYLVVPYKLTWNYNFIKSVRNALDYVSSNAGAGRIVIMAKDPKDFLLGKKTVHYISDYDRYDLIKQQFSDEKEFRVQVKVRDINGNVVIDTCHLPQYKQGSMFYNLNYNGNITVFGNDQDIDNIVLKIDIPLSRIYDVNVNVAAAKDCKLLTNR